MRARMKNIAMLVPDALQALHCLKASAEKGGVVIERLPGLDFYLDPSIVKSSDAERIRSVLKDALASLEKRNINFAS